VTYVTHAAETVCATESKAGLSAENRNRKSIVSGPKPNASLMPACHGPQATVPDADVDSATSFLGYLYIVNQYTVRLMTSCVWRILCLRNSRSLYPTFRNHRICQLQHAETESAPTVERLLSAETECQPKVPICPHSAPKLKPKFGRPLVQCNTLHGTEYKITCGVRLCVCVCASARVFGAKYLKNG